MQANPRTIDELFNSQSRYVIPMFQRLYVWSESPQWRTLWEDIAEKATLGLDGKKANAHYLGALIIEGVKPSTGKEVKRLLVIDGQQRLTTIQLLLCAFRDLSGAEEWTALERKATRYLENSDSDVMEKPEEELFKIWPTQLNRAVFADIITAQSRAEVERRHPLVRLPRRRKPEPRPNLVDGYLFFYNMIAEWITSEATSRSLAREDCAFALLKAIQHDFCVVEISLSEGDDSQEIFYSLNSQGRPLSQSDLLRSLIFMRAEKTKEDRDALFTEFWSKFETDFWSTEIRRGGRTYSRLDLALRHFLTAKTGTLIDARRVNEEYKRWVESQPPRYPTVHAELADLSRHAELFKKYELQQPGRKSSDFVRILQDLDVSTCIPLILYLSLEAAIDEASLSECLAAIESFIVRRAFTGEENREYNKFFVEVIGALREVASSNVPSVLKTKLMSGGGTTREWPADEAIISAALQRPIYKALRPPVLRLILERLELSLRGKKSENEEIPTSLQIEHVMPQSWAQHWKIGQEAVDQKVVNFPWTASEAQKHLLPAIQLRTNALQTLGNLTLLNQYLNPAAANGPFVTKRAEYEHSVLRMNRYFAGRASWDEEAIAERGKQLAEQFCKIWSRPAASPQQG
jgi:uncharacterized protein with ParB-like and HNH nuclease domain